MSNPIRVALGTAIFAALVIPLFITQCGSPLENACGRIASHIAILVSMPALLLAAGLLNDEQVVAYLPYILAVGTFIWAFLLVYLAARLAGYFRRAH
jgi:hypothetical protein